MSDQTPLSAKCEYPDKPWFASDDHQFDAEAFFEYTDNDGNVESDFMCNKCQQVKTVRTEYQ